MSAEMPGREPCAACGNTVDFPGTAVCVRCLSARHRGDDVLLFLRPPGRAERERAVRQVAALAGVAPGTGLSQGAVRGQLALLRVPRPAADAVARAFVAHGLAPRMVPAARAWTSMPAHFFLLLFAIVAAGGAGSNTAPLLLFTSPLLALTLLLSAQSKASRPLVGGGKPRRPAAARSRVIETLAALPPGDARRLLADLVALAQPALDAHDENVARTAGELLIAAADTAAEVHRFENMLHTLERRNSAELAAFDVRAAAETCARVRRTGIERLEAAAHALGQLVANTLADGASERLAELTSELIVEAQARNEAARRVDLLLSAGDA